MRKVKKFGIILKTDRKVFYPGDEIEGHVFLELCGSMKMASIQIEMQGDIYAEWKTGAGEERREWNEKEKIFEFDKILFGDKKDNKKEHQSGFMEFPFQFKLPAGIPSSFEYKSTVKSYVRYHLQAKIDRPWKWNHEVTMPLIINQIVDINDDKFAQAVGGENHKEIGCLCMVSGVVDMKASVARTGVCPGENIIVNGTFQNTTDKDLDPPKIKLVQEIDFKADGASWEDKNTICKWEDSRLLPASTVTWTDQPFFIPPLPPTMTTKKNVIQIKYYMEVEVDIPMALDPTIKLPITIGTVPFRGTYGITKSPNNYSIVPKQKFDDDYKKELGPTEFPPSSTFWDSVGMSGEQPPPPEYAFAVGQISVDIKGKGDVTYGNSKYMPAYTLAKPSSATESTTVKLVTPLPPPTPEPPQKMPHPPTSSAEVDIEQPNDVIAVSPTPPAETIAASPIPMETHGLNDNNDANPSPVTAVE